jgi:chromosomal replication initiator protein DnaA
MANRSKSRLGELLLERKVVNKKQLNRALKRQQEEGALLGSILVDMGLLSEEVLKTFLAEQCQVPNLDLSTASPSEEAVNKLDRTLAVSLTVLPLTMEGQRLTVVMGDPLDPSAVETLKEATGCEIDPVFAPAESIREALPTWYETRDVLPEAPAEIGPPTLASFRVGAENERAYNTSLRVGGLEAGAPSPLILVGPRGSGKSHLLQGIRAEMAAHSPGANVVLVSCVGATEDTVSELEQATEAAEHLLVDDLHELAGFDALERATLGAVNRVFSRRGKVVATSSKRPQELRRLNPGLVLSLGLGKVIEVGPLPVPKKAAAPKDEPVLQEEPRAETVDGLRDEAEAIIQEGRMALDDVRKQVDGEPLESELEEAELLWQESKVSFERGEHEQAERLGMEALEKAALLQKRAKEGVGFEGAAATDQDSARGRLDEVRKLLLRAAKAGAEEYASKEMKTAAAMMEEAEAELDAGGEATSALAKLERAAQSAVSAEKKARKYRDQDRLRQEEERRRRARHAVAKLDETINGLAVDDLGVRLESHVEDLKAVIQSATAYLDADNYGQALELALDGRRMADELLEKTGQRAELRQIVKQVDGVLRQGDLRTSNDPWVGQQLVEIQNALSEAERVLLGDSEDYALGLNWARVAQQKAAKLVGRELFDNGEQEVVDVKKPSKVRLRKRFAGFATGECNRFAYSVARAAAENPQGIRSPLYIYGDIGMGKTHLLSAIMAAVEESSRDRTVVFVSADDFSNEFRAAEDHGRLDAFRSRYRTPDLLLVDDVQYLVEREREARELLHTLGAIERTGGLVVATADRPPRELPGLSSGLRSRLEGGVIARLRPPDLETRKLMVRMEAKREGTDLSEEAIGLLANLVDSNPRDLLGTYGKVAAYSSVTEKQVDAALIEEALQEVLPAGKRLAGGRGRK